MTETPHNPPPGFYPDGQGASRYWDGSTWTEQLQPSSSSSVNAAPASRPGRPWFKKKRFVIPAALVALLIVGGAVTGGGTSSGKEEAKVSDAKAVDKTDDKAADAADVDETEEPAAVVTPKAAKVTKPPAKPKATKKPEPTLTSGQENALAAAENYLSIAPFSHDGLIQQLSSEYGDGYSKADAAYAADHVDVDYKEQAVKAAKNYLDISPFSRSGMVEQLSSEYGDQYTREQAEYGATKAGL